MNIKIYWVLFFLILLISFTIRILPVLNNNFHFTMDQGDDAVHVREIVERGQMQLVGPETNITGLFTGPLWYYFLSIGYIVFSGHPMSAVILLIFLSLITTSVIIYEMSKRFSLAVSLFIGAAMQIFWWFYDVSRYGFNPFPLVALTISVVFLFCDFLEKPKKQFILIAVLIGLAFHAELAGATALFLFSVVVLIFLLILKKITFTNVFVALFIVSLFLFPKFLYEFNNGFSIFSHLKNQASSVNGVFSQNRLQPVAVAFLEMFLNSAVPEKPLFSLLIWGATLLISVRARFWKKSKFVFRFSLLSLSFVFISWIFFGSNTGWRVWHTAAIPSLLFLDLLLLVLTLPRFAKLILFSIVLTFQFLFFVRLYGHFLSPIDDESILRNEMRAIDWVYQRADLKGFYVYNYIPSVRDYSHQYLFWWYGRKNYGYVPCEYGRFPNVPSFYVPGYEYYQKPQKPCAKLRFLIIEPDNNVSVFSKWYEGVTKDTELLDKSMVGKITVEKRKLLL